MARHPPKKLTDEQRQRKREVDKLYRERKKKKEGEAYLQRRRIICKNSYKKCRGPDAPVDDRTKRIRRRKWKMAKRLCRSEQKKEVHAHEDINITLDSTPPSTSVNQEKSDSARKREFQKSKLKITKLKHRIKKLERENWKLKKRFQRNVRTALITVSKLEVVQIAVADTVSCILGVPV